MKYIQKAPNKKNSNIIHSAHSFSFHFQHFELDAHVYRTSIISFRMEHHQDPWEQVCALLTGGKVSPAEVFMLGMQALEAANNQRGGKVNLKRARRIILLGAKNLEEMEQSVSVAQAARDMLESKKDRLRPVSLKGLRALTGKLLRDRPDLARRQVRGLDTASCREWLNDSFHTPRRFLNGRAALSAVCSHAIRRGWAERNPVAGVDIPVIREHRITALPARACALLLRLAGDMHHGECLAAAGMMLFAGIRPAEVERLRWKHVCLEDKVISIPPQHSKTGGARHVSLQPALASILKRVRRHPETPVTPANWKQKWQQVRARFSALTGKPWQADVLRHTFASYHARQFRDFASLQMDMGHSNLSLLRTRYLNMEGISIRESAAFWQLNYNTLFRGTLSSGFPEKRENSFRQRLKPEPCLPS